MRMPYHATAYEPAMPTTEKSKTITGDAKIDQIQRQPQRCCGAPFVVPIGDCAPLEKQPVGDGPCQRCRVSVPGRRALATGSRPIANRPNYVGFRIGTPCAEVY